jgi:hypothetical protein
MGASPIDALDQARSAPMYWGDQPIVEAPAYIGAVIVFLFILGLVLVKGKTKWWLVAGVVFSLLLSFGKNFSLLTNFFIDYVPLYNKFRAVSSIQVILELCAPALGILGLAAFIKTSTGNDQRFKALKLALGITGGLALLFLIFKTSLFDFTSLRDSQYRQYYGQNFVDALVKDRIALFNSDTLRSLILVLILGGLLLLFIRQKISRSILLTAVGLLILIDLTTVDWRYVNADSFVSAINVDRPYRLNSADKEILKDKGHYRVLDLSSEGRRAPARAAYFHNSLTGYHAAKIGRMNDLLDFYIYKNNLNVLNMLNTKYIIAEDETGALFPYQNEETNGNAWFVERLQPVLTADDEILSLDSLDTKKVAVIRSSMMNAYDLKQEFEQDSLSAISLIEHRPNYLKYQSNSNADAYAVFSEVYYGEGWQAYMNGKPMDHQQVNYVLRGLPVPPGSNVIEFRFEPQVVKTGSKMALGTSILWILLMGTGLFFRYQTFKKKG